ncbi:TPA: PTS sugar transporter subunit IIA [Streptococcus suis]
MKKLYMADNKIISPELIFLDEALSDKSEIIKYIAKKAKAIGYIIDEQVFYETVMKREAEVPTAIGYDIAIPHGKTDIIVQPFIAFVRTKEKFIWTEGFEDEVQLIFQIGVPETGNEKLHLKFISEVSKKLLNEEFREQLKSIVEHNAVFELLNSIEV